MDYIELKLSPAQQERFRKAVDDAGPIEQWIKDAVTQFKDLQNRAHSIAEFVKYKTVSIPG